MALVAVPQWNCLFAGSEATVAGDWPHGPHGLNGLKYYDLSTAALILYSKSSIWLRAVISFVASTT